MEIKNQVVSLELAKKMKELGFKQESLFWWNRQDMPGDDFVIQVGMHKIHESYGEPLCSAYTVAELGEMLPDLLRDKFGENQLLTINKRSNKNWYVDYGGFLEGIYFEADTEADARAKMLIYLKENKLI